MDILAGMKLEKLDKSLVDANEALAGKIVGIYFSAHWCGPCRNFTPVLKDFYEEVQDDFEIVFASSDQSESDLKNYMEECHGNWYYIPFGNDAEEKLSTKYDVSTIPTLIFLKPDGTEVTRYGRKDVEVGRKNPKEIVAKCLK
ncbi:Thioredoxin domain-containing protein [Caenorhabditis elegans]|uniref:Thioredoxin domain-containing protein n=1 Tax=Caenorhabditis elegans TaxID=6239 RepID=O61985_CAEEL|nr:Thioredoxin domain-containing protein [Caenorhabditis elegans]CCD67034.1 Thioredoxin domain-containing protein [Caenorhabditis elegans]|eukprot:NP_503440.2 ThioRedoXin [see also xtr] [Caenorhabditis elegans]